MTLSIGWPQAILLALFVMTICGSATKHGTPKGDYDVGGTLICSAIELALLYWGGFFG